RVGFELLHAERNAPVLRLYFENDGLHLVADLYNLAGMLHPAAPGHFRNMDKTLDARLELHECAVVGDAHHAAHYPASRRVMLGSSKPRIGRELLHAERYAFLVAIELQHPDRNLVADVEDFRRVSHAAVRNIAHMQQTVDAAEVHEST